MSGDTQDFSVISEPPGAIVTIDGEKKLTPTVFFLNRTRKSYVVSVEKPGFKAVTIDLKKGTNGWAWGNIISGGLGLIIDFSTGSIQEFIPKEIHIDFLREKVGYKQLKHKVIFVV